MDRLLRYRRRTVLLSVMILGAGMFMAAKAADTQPAAAPVVKAAPGEPAAVPAAPRKPVAEMLYSGKILPSSYSRLDMEPRSINYQTVSEYQYWMNTGQYFESRTWDWQDDADEFAQALRCYQTAQDLATAGMGAGSTAAQDADERVRKVLESRQKWIETAKPRAEMAELELKSTLAQRLDNINKSLLALQSNVDGLNQSRANYETSLAAYQRDVNARLDRMSEDIRRYYDAIRSSVYTQPGVIVTPYPAPQPAQ
jgi:hypothetical protein